MLEELRMFKSLYALYTIYYVYSVYGKRTKIKRSKRLLIYEVYSYKGALGKKAVTYTRETFMKRAVPIGRKKKSGSSEPIHAHLKNVFAHIFAKK
jgi:hypothetical protein